MFKDHTYAADSSKSDASDDAPTYWSHQRTSRKTPRRGRHRPPKVPAPHSFVLLYCHEISQILLRKEVFIR